MEKKKDPKEKAFAALINYLSYRDRSIAEAKQYLEKKEHARAAIRQAIEKAMEYGYLDDEKFADVFVRGKVIERKTSPKKIQFELGKKEVSQAYIHKALQTHYGEDVEEEIVLSWIEKLDQKYRKEPFLQRKRKIASSLEQKGFSHSVVKQCLEAHSFIRELEDEGKKELQKRYEKLVRKYERKGLDPFEKKQKIIQALLSKGYDYSTVKNWMEQWENSNF